MPPIARNTLSSQVAEHIRQAVFYGTLKPGDTVTELAVARELAVSQAPVREALQVLMAEGFVRRKGKQGKCIARFTPSEIKDAYFAGGVLEGAAVAAALPRFTNADTARIKDMITHMSVAAENKDAMRLAALDTEFHQFLFDKGGSLVIRELWFRSCQMPGKYFFHQKWRDTRYIRMAPDRHRAIADAIASRNPEAVEKIIREHYATAGEILAAYAGEMSE